MKKIAINILMFLFVASTAAFTIKPGSLVNDQKKIEISFTQSTGFTELVMIRETLAKQHIVLNYKKIEYNDNGKLKAISFHVDCQDGFSGGASSENIAKSGKFGFYRDYSENSSDPFGAGGFK